MDDGFDDLLPPTAPKRGRPTNEERARRAEQALQDSARQAEVRRAGAGHSKIAVEDLKFLPVPQNWLARFFEMDPMTVRKRLRQCPIAGKSGHNKEVYLFHEAVPYLIKPKMTAEQFAKTLNKADLPPEINNVFWNAQRARIRYKLEAQEAWETEDVVRLLGEVAMALKDSLTMLPEEMRQRAKLTDEQVAIVERTVDGLRTEIAQKLIQMADGGETDSMFDKPLFGVSEGNEVNRMPDQSVWDGDDEA